MKVSVVRGSDHERKRVSSSKSEKQGAIHASVISEASNVQTV